MLNNLKNLFLNRYNDKDYTLIQKSKILFSLLIAVFLISLLILIFNIFRGHTAPEFQIPISLLIVTSVLSFIILQRGFYELSSFLLIVSVTINFWIIIFMDPQQPLFSRMSSVIFIQINLILVPLLILRKKLAILLAYFITNILIFSVFAVHISSDPQITDFILTDYITDNTIAMTLMAIASYYIYTFNDRTVDKASDAEKKTIEQNLELERTNSFLEQANRDLISYQKELQNSEEKYRTIVELTEEIIWSADTSGFFTFVNSAVERVYGYTPQEIIGYHLSKLTKDEFVRHETGIMRDMISKKLTSTRYETTHFRKDGSPVNFLISAVLIHGENGEISGITGIAADITKQKQAESRIQQQNEELGASNEEFEAMNEELIRSQQELLSNEKALKERDREMRAVLNATIDMVMLLDRSGLILIHNNASSQQFAEHEKPRTGMNYFDYLARHGMTGRLELIKGVAESGQGIRFEDKNGDYTFDISVYPITNEKDTVDRIALYSKDITGRKNAELKIQEQNEELSVAARKFETMNEELVMRQIDIINSEMKYRHLYENAIVGMATTRISDGMILKMNEMALQLFGYSAQEEIMEARSIDEFYVDPEERTRFLKELNERGSLHNHELKFRRKDGTILWVELAAKILVKEGKIDSVFTDISKRKIAEENVHKLTFYDPLTDLPNKQLFRDRLGIAIIKSQRKSKDAIFAVMCVGIDRFKNINDMHGTAAGDMLLKAIAKRLLATFREDDVVSRFDGDKFMTLFSDIASTDDIIDVVRKTFASFENPFLIADEEMYITASLGVCVYPNDGENAEQLINNSESAMYASKERGRGTYQLFDAELNEGLLSRIKMETDLKNAIMEKELETYFQPKVSHDGTILGMESLIRWHSQARGPVSPSQFIGIAEKNGMIVDIGNLVFRESCRLTKKWLDQGFPPLRVSVNISPYQFREDYISTIQAILKDTGLDPGLLEIEITESGIMENEEENIRKLHQLHALGVSISIDDFGTGYSSLSKLKEYPIDTLKIDKSFIDELPHNDKSVTLARTIIDMAHNLGFRVVAEGIERAEQLEFLKNAECDMYQGYYFSRAIPAGEFEERLRVMFGEKA